MTSNSTTQKITPHLWFDQEAVAAAKFYTQIFGNSPAGESKITNTTTIKDTPSGDCDIVSFQIWDYHFMAISAGPLFKFTPAISMSVQCRSEAEIDQLWAKLSENGETLMPLEKYPWSKKYGWLKDRYGLSWQLNLPNDQATITQRINPSLMFVGSNCGQAEAAINFYTEIFPDSKVVFMARYEKGEEPDKAGTIKHAEFTLAGELFMALDSAQEHKFTFNEAVSLMVNCQDQTEIDYYWDKLSAEPEAEQCGWLKDKYGVSWQIVPAAMDQMMAKGTPEQIARLIQAFLPMKKFVLADLEKAYQGK